MQSQAPTPGFFIRPATIEVRYRGKKDYANAKEFYTKIFGKPIDSKSVEACSFYIITPKKDSSELLLAHDGNWFDGNQTIVYWQIAGGTAAELIKADSTVRSSLPGSKVRERPFRDDRVVISKIDESPYRSVVEDGAGNYVGLVINPSIPLTDRVLAAGVPSSHFPDPAILLALAACLAGGIVVGKFWR